MTNARPWWSRESKSPSLRKTQGDSVASIWQWFEVELTAENMRQLFIPVGFSHAFLALSESAELQYKCSGYYEPKAEGAITWNDPEVGVEWPIKDPIMSARDRRAPTLREYRVSPAFRYGAPVA
jgi:dTDP-4-dehydrorhamnose 3,5-epimerase